MMRRHTIIVCYISDLSAVDGSLPLTETSPTSSSVEVAEANKVWHQFLAVITTVNVKHPWLTSDAAVLDVQTVSSGLAATTTPRFRRFLCCQLDYTPSRKRRPGRCINPVYSRVLRSEPWQEKKPE